MGLTVPRRHAAGRRCLGGVALNPQFQLLPFFFGGSCHLLRISPSGGFGFYGGGFAGVPSGALTSWDGLDCWEDMFLLSVYQVDNFDPLYLRRGTLNCEKWNQTDKENHQ